MIGRKKVVLWIDEEQRSLDTYTPFLKECFGDEVAVLPEIPKDELSEMLTVISSQPDLIAIVLDQRLKTTGKTKYTGIELAEAIRSIDTKIPVYMLTNYPAEIGDLDYQVEYILEKDHLYEEAYLKTITARVRRHADIYQDIVSEREKRFNELLRKTIDSSLTEEEQKEFKELDFWRNKSIYAEEESWAEDLKKNLDKNQVILEELRKQLEGKKK